IDVCRDCRGIWLDRGELEKLITRAMADQDMTSEPPNHGSGGYDNRDKGYSDKYAPKYENKGKGYHDSHHKHRKRSWLESLTDIFD
ncbi:MAG: zf-TFIIB domain-containing protein, partial [Deltaproteobacteria bacterium]|nr:zf-TFIIB domain-containing protein [Deltaproteobacteria bacterium]